MNYAFDEFCPQNPVLLLGTGEIELSNISLKHLVKLESEYGDLEQVLELISKEPTKLLNILWILVFNKSAFDNNYKTFYNTFLSNSIQEATEIAYKSFHKAIANSMPLIKNARRYKEIQKIKKTQSEEQGNATCYASIYDSFASRYGYSIEDFYNLTMRQIHILLEKAEDGRYKELEVQASLAGKQLKPRVTFSDFSDEEEAEHNEEATSAFQRLKKEYEERQKGKE